MDKTSRQNISKKTEVLNNTLKLDLKDKYRTLHSRAEYTFFSSAQGTFFKIEPIRPQNQPQLI